MQIFALVVTAALLVTSTLAQYNDVEPDYGDFGAAPAPPPPRGSIAPRSYSLSRGQQLQATASRPTPVPILKQINRHNEDGSYTYGYEGADGSFKIETKLNSGEVVGKYGYVDDVGKVRVVEYGANKFGFQPSGEGITVAPPTLVDESSKQKGNKNSYYEPESDDGQYYESPAPRPAPRPAPQNYAPPRPAPAPVRPPPPRQPAPTYENFERTIEFGGPSPNHRAPSSPGPAPPRAQIPGAVPVPSGFSGGSPSRSSAPTQAYFQPSGPAPRPPPPQRAQPPPPQAHRPPPSSHGGRPGGILDQLAKDYALPSNGAPALHDISFGYY